MIDILFTT